jgi:nucleoside-diphosphate-sugar epimerase
MILVTGITGHTGNFFLQELVKNQFKERFRCIVRESSDTSILDESYLNFEKVYGDLEDLEFLIEAMKGVDTILHIAGIQKSIKVLNAAVLNKVSRGIFVHTTGIYSRFKSASEEYIKIESQMNSILKSNNGIMKVVLLRPTMIYGDLCDLNMSKFIKMVDYLRFFPIIKSNESIIQPVNARDLGKAYFLVLQSIQGSLKSEYILSGESPLLLKDALIMISNFLGKRIFFMNFPLQFAVFLSKITKFLTFKKLDYVEKVQRLGENRSFSHLEASNDFGYLPMSFKEGIESEVYEYLEKKRGKKDE